MDLTSLLVARIPAVAVGCAAVLFALTFAEIGNGTNDPFVVGLQRQMGRLGKLNPIRFGVYAFCLIFAELYVLIQVAEAIPAIIKGLYVFVTAMCARSARAPRACPWGNKLRGGRMRSCKPLSQDTVYIKLNTTSYGVLNTAEGS